MDAAAIEQLAGGREDALAGGQGRTAPLSFGGRPCG